MSLPRVVPETPFWYDGTERHSRGHVMANLNEPNGTPGGDGQNGPGDSSSRDALLQRVHELERENATLKADLAALQKRHDTDRDLLLSMIISELPQNEAEYQEMVAKSRSLSDLLREMETKFGLESPK